MMRLSLLLKFLSPLGIQFSLPDNFVHAVVKLFDWLFKITAFKYRVCSQNARILYKIAVERGRHGGSHPLKFLRFSIAVDENLAWFIKSQHRLNTFLNKPFSYCILQG